MTVKKGQRRLPYTITMREDVKDKFHKKSTKKDSTMSREIENLVIKDLKDGK